MGALGGAAAFPARGRRGLAAIAAAIAVSFLDAAWAPSAASLLCWWGLALTLDAAAYWRRGGSVLHDAPDAFVWMAVLSIFLGVAMEWAAGRLAAWSYLGLPFQEFLRYGVQGSAFAAFLPALHGAAALVGASPTPEPGPEPAPRWPITAGILLGAACPVIVLGVPTLVGGWPGLLIVHAGLWGFCDSWNALRGRPSLLRSPARRLPAWVLAGLLLIGFAAFVTGLTGQGRYPTGYEPPRLYAYFLLAFLGPALRAAYLFLADTLGLPAWPPREESTALLR